MATQQEVIKKFMSSLDNTSLSGADALDEAIVACSDGKFSSMQDLIDSFISDATKSNYTYSQRENFLKEYCGIILDNSDTGSIVGSDAGSGITYTAESIVNEIGNTIVYPTGTSSTINGLTLHWPDMSTLSTAEKSIVGRLYTWWTQGALDLIEKAYGLSFNEAGTSVKDITVKFYSNSGDSALASVLHTYSPYSGKTTALTLNVNMAYYGNVSTTDKDGVSNNYSAMYLDRTLAHEFTHAVMSANINYFSNLPMFVTEGLAELIHGIDDRRSDSIHTVVYQDADTLRQLFSIRGTYYDYGRESYAGGYVLFRYLAKQAATTNGGTVSPVSSDSVDYSKSTTGVTVKGGSQYKKIVGSAYNDNITASTLGTTITGGKGNDTIYAGTGTDTIQYASGDGADTIYNFSAVDKIKFTSDSLKGIAAASTGTDVVITTTSGGKMTLKAATGKTLNVVNSAGATTKYVVGRNDANNAFTWVNGVRYIGTAKTDTLNVNTAGGTVDLMNTTLYKSIDAINASKATKAVTIKGGAQAVNITGSNYNDTIKAGSKGGTITGGKGNDSITAGAGVDTVVIADGMGTDTVTGFSASDKIKVTSSTYNVSASGADVVITAGTGKAVIKSGTGKNIQVVDSKGATTKFNVGKKDTANTFTWSSGVNYVGSSKTDTVNVNTGGANADLSKSSSIENINASKANKAVTIKGGAFASAITGSAYADKITAGSKGGTIRAGKGNDTIYAGAGTDTIQYAKGEGNDTIYNISSSDKIKFVSDSLKTIAAVATGTDVVITTANGSKMTLKAATGKTLNVVNSAGTTTKYVVGRNDANNAFTWVNGVRYIGTGKTDTLNVNAAGGTVDLTNTTLYKSIDAVNASKATKAVTIKSGAQAVNITGSNYNDTIKAGSKGGTITGGKGNDSITAGAGVDTIVIADGMGTDTITGFSASDKIKVTSSTYNVAASGADVVVAAGTGKAVIKSGVGKNIQVVDSKGVTTKFSVGKKDTANTFTWSSGVNYIGNNKIDTVNVNTGGANADLSKSSSIENINASKANKAVTIKGGAFASTITGSAYADKITAGSKGDTIRAGKGNDTIYAGAGTDTIQYAKGEGNDIIYNLSSSDKIKFVSDSLKTIAAAATGTDVVITTANGSKMTLKSATGKALNVVDSAGTTTKYVVGRNDANNAFTWASGVRYIGTAKTDTLNVNTAGGTVDLTNTTLYKSIDAVNASKATKAVTIKGGAQKVNITGSNYNDTIKAGSKGGTITGGKGNDSITAGAGVDTIVIADGMGTDAITGFSASDKIKVTSSTYNVSANGADVVVTAGTGKAVIKSGTGKNIQVVDSKGAIAKFNVGKKDSANTFTWASDVNYIGNNKTDTVNVNTGGAKADLSKSSSIENINASKANKAVTIKGGAFASTITGSVYADKITAGSKGDTIRAGKGNDTIYAGAGTDTIQYAKGEGNDIIYNLSSSDKIKFVSDSLKTIAAAATGTDVVITTANGSKMTLKSATGKTLNVVDSAGATTKYVVGRNDANNAFTWASGVRYIGTAKTDTLNVNTAGGTVDLTNTTLYKSIDAVNASKATKAVTIKGGATKTTLTGSAYADTITGDNNGGAINGGAGNDIITAGSKGNTINGGAGNDTIKAGAGTDTILISNGMGTDTVTGFSTSDRVKVSSGTLTSIAAASTGTDVTVTAGTGKVVLKAMTGKTIQMMDSAGTITKYVIGRNDTNNTFTWTSGVRYVGTGKTDTLNVNTAGGTVDLTNTTLYKSIDAVNASKATKAVTIKGGSQKVNITGSAYADTLTGANVAGGTVSGGAGNDTIKAGSKGGTFIGGKGDDKIYAGAGADVIKFAAGDGDDTVYNFNNSTDTVRLTSGSVVDYKVVNGNGVITTNDGTITLNGYAANSVYVTGSDGVKRSYSSEIYVDGLLWSDNNTKVKLSENYSTTYGSYFAGYNYSSLQEIDGSNVNSSITIAGNSLDNIIRAGQAGGSIDGYGGDDIIYLGAGNDKVCWYSYEGNDTVYGFNSSYDTIYLNDYVSNYSYAESGNDIVITNSSYNSTLTLKDSNTTDVKNYLSGLGIEDHSDIYTNGLLWSDNDTKVKLSENYSIAYSSSFSAGNYSSLQEIDGSNVNSSITINGNDLNNIIRAGQAGGSIDGYGGDDIIYLGAGNDTIRWYVNEGNDTVYDFNATYDTIYLGNDSNMSHYSYAVSGNDIVITNSSYNSTLTLKDSNNIDVKNYLSGLGIEAESIIDPTPQRGITWNSDKTSVTIDSGYIYSSFSADSYSSLKSIDGSAVTAYISISGNDLDNVIKGGTGGGYLSGGSGDDIIYSGNTTGWNSTSIQGGSGNDTLYLSEGKDTVNWYGDSYYGSDIVYNFDASEDTVYFGSDNSNELTYRTSGSDIIISSKNNTTLTLKDSNTTTVKNYLSNIGINYSSTGIYIPIGLTFNSNKTSVTIGSNYTYSSFSGDSYSSLKTIDGSAVTAYISINGNDLNNVIKGGTGGGYLSGGSGDDIIYSGNTTSWDSTSIQGGSGNDTLYLSEGKDTVNWYGDSYYGSDIVYNFDASEDTVYFGSNNSNELTYRISGNDIIVSSKNNTTLTLKASNTFEIKNYLSSIGINYSSDGAYVPIGMTFNSNKTSVAIGSNYTYSSFSGDSYSSLKTIDGSAVTAYISISGNDLDNVIKGGTGGGYLSGGSGDDIIYSGNTTGWDSSTSIQGGSGNDTLYLSEGKDTVNWYGDSYYGSDIVYNFDASEDTVYFGSDNSNELTYRTSGSDIIVTSKNNTTLTLKDVNDTATKTYLEGIGIYASSSSYQSTLGCISSSIDASVQSPVVSGSLIGTAYQSDGALSQGVTVNTASSELAKIQHQYS